VREREREREREINLEDFENKVLTRKFVTKKDEATGSWRNIYNENLVSFFFTKSL
jgi:hypothetical protein